MPTSTDEKPEPAFCEPCGKSNGFGRSPVTGFWVCDACGKPRRLWWLSQRRLINKASKRGYCTQWIGTQKWEPIKCDGHKEDE